MANQQRIDAMKQYLHSQEQPASADSARMEAMKLYASRSQHAFNPANPASQKNLDAITKGSSQSTMGNFAKSVPGALANVFLKTPAKTVVSLGEIAANPVDTAKGQATGKTYNLPVIGPVRSIQSDAAELFPKIVEGQEPLYKAATGPILDSVVGPLDTVATATGIKNVYRGGEKLVSSAATKLAEKSAAKVALKAEQAAGRIVQGATEDIGPAKQVLSKINYRKVKTYEDLERELAANEKALVKAKGDALATDPTRRKLTELTTNAGKESHNYVQDALDQLEQHYQQTNNVAKLYDIRALRTKAINEGLTIKEVDDLAVLHGQDLNAYNKSGDLAAALSKQNFENTRAGLKTTGRDLFGNKLYQRADAELSATINTRKLVQKQVEEVNKLRQKIQNRDLLEQVGRVAGRALDVITGRGAKGFIEYFLSRGTGLKTLNALDLEKQLRKNLELLQRANGAGASDTDVLRALQELIGESETDPLKNYLKNVERGQTTHQTIVPETLTYAKPNPKKLVKVTDYRNPDYPQYLTPDRQARAAKVLRYAENKGKSIDIRTRK